MYGKSGEIENNCIQKCEKHDAMNDGIYRNDKQKNLCINGKKSKKFTHGGNICGNHLKNQESLCFF